MKIQNMNYARFKSEEELLKSILHSLSLNTYPKVSAIAGKKINPDIDILEIRKVSQNQYRLIGYELKLMKVDKSSKGLGWDPFYRGIGQALLYLKNGIHRVVLILGFHENVPNDKIENFRDWLFNKKELLRQIIGNHVSVVTYLYERGPISPIIEAIVDFYPSDDEVKFLSESLLKKRFTFDKRLKGEKVDLRERNNK